MAGDGSRFGGTFKPFLKVKDEFFIEASLRPFIKWKKFIKEFVFVFREDQERKYKVSTNLKSLFPDLNISSVILPSKTSGPVETVTQAIEEKNLFSAAIFCDCDHSVNVDPIFKLIATDNQIECIIPAWTIESKDFKSWSIVSLDHTGNILDISEKQKPKEGVNYFGIIGSYYFKDNRKVVKLYREFKFENFSEVIKEFSKEGRKISICHIKKARFFGDPERLNTH